MVLEIDCHDFCLLPLFKVSKAKASDKKKKNARKEFKVDLAVDDLLPVPPSVPRANKNLYSWGYHRHEALFKDVLPPLVLKEQCRLVGQGVAAFYLAEG